MFFFQIVVLMILTFFHNGETVKDSSSHTNDNMIELYNNLLNVDTGYRNETHNEPEEITENAVAVAKETVCRNLLCSYVFTCRYYMSLIKNLVNRASVGFFKTAFKYDMINAAYFQNQIVAMFFVLKHLGTVNSLDPLWLTYVYMDCLKTVASSDCVSQQDIRKRILIRDEHGAIFRLLTKFTDSKCRPDNAYNHRHNESEYFKELKKLNDMNADTLLNILITDIVETTDTRHTQAIQSLGIGNVRTYFVIEDLRLSHIMLDDNIMKIFLDDFAEAKNNNLDALEIIQKNCSSDPLKSVSVRSLVVEVRGCLVIFVNLIKYIIVRQAFKYILDVHSSLPLAENKIQSQENLTQWIRQSNLMTTNKKMLDNYIEIISFLNLGEDKELKFVVELFNSAPHVTFRNPKKNADNEKRIKKMLDKFSKELHLLPSLKVARADFDPSFKSQRKAVALNLAERLKVEVADSDDNEYEGMVDIFVFKVFITRQYGDTNFDVPLSFYEFSKEML